MLKVTVKNEKVVDERWEPGVIRMSENGRSVILIVEDYNDSYRIVLLKNEIRAGATFFAYSNTIATREYWSKRCPIVVENAELIIGG